MDAVSIEIYSLHVWHYRCKVLKALSHSSRLLGCLHVIARVSSARKNVTRVAIVYSGNGRSPICDLRPKVNFPRFPTVAHLCALDNRPFAQVKCRIRLGQSLIAHGDRRPHANLAGCAPASRLARAAQPPLHRPPIVRAWRRRPALSIREGLDACESQRQGVRRPGQGRPIQQPFQRGRPAAP